MCRAIVAFIASIGPAIENRVCPTRVAFATDRSIRPFPAHPA